LKKFIIAVVVVVVVVVIVASLTHVLSFNYSATCCTCHMRQLEQLGKRLTIKKFFLQMLTYRYICLYRI